MEVSLVLAVDGYNQIPDNFLVNRCAAIERNKLLHTDTFISLFLSRISESNQCSKFIQVIIWNSLQ